MWEKNGMGRLFLDRISKNCRYVTDIIVFICITFNLCILVILIMLISIYICDVIDHFYMAFLAIIL